MGIYEGQCDKGGNATGEGRWACSEPVADRPDWKGTIIEGCFKNNAPQGISKKRFILANSAIFQVSFGIQQANVWRTTNSGMEKKRAKQLNTMSKSDLFLLIENLVIVVDHGLTLFGRQMTGQVETEVNHTSSLIFENTILSQKKLVHLVDSNINLS